MTKIDEMLEALKKAASPAAIAEGKEVTKEVTEWIQARSKAGRSSMPIRTQDAIALVMLSEIALELMAALTQEGGDGIIADEAAPAAQTEEEPMARNGTIAYVAEPKECDFCKLTGTESERQSPAKAEFDFRTKDGHWANGCNSHYIQHRMHTELGVGKGQMLKVRPDIVSAVRR